MSLPGNCYTDGLSVNVSKHRGMRGMGSGRKGVGVLLVMSETRLHDCAGCSRDLFFTNVKD